MRRGAWVLAVALLAASCGSEENDASDTGRLTVFEAASPTEVFEALAPDVTFTLKGSDELATQIREGAPADVYAAASPRYSNELAAQGFLIEPTIFATNRLVVVVPPDNPACIESVEELAAEDVKLVIGAEGVPVGDYTRSILEDLGASDALDNVVSAEQDVKGVLGKVVSGDADAGFVYVTDAAAAGDDVRAVELPAQPLVEYPIAVLTESENAEAAEAFVELVLSEEGRRALQEAGFGVP